MGNENDMASPRQRSRHEAGKGSPWPIDTQYVGSSSTKQVWAKSTVYRYLRRKYSRKGQRTGTPYRHHYQLNKRQLKRLKQLSVGYPTNNKIVNSRVMHITNKLAITIHDHIIISTSSHFNIFTNIAVH